MPRRCIEPAGRLRRCRVHQPKPLRIAARHSSHARLHGLRLRLRLFGADRGRVRNRSRVARLASRCQSGSQREPARSVTAASHHRLRYGLIVGEVAFAVILLAGAGLFLRGLQRFEIGLRLACGWTDDGQLGLLGDRYSTPPQRLLFYQQLEQRLLAIPGVQHVAFSNSMPVFSFNSSGNVLIEGRPEPEPGKEPEAFFEQVSLAVRHDGRPAIAGRLFTSSDAFDAHRSWSSTRRWRASSGRTRARSASASSRTDRMPFESSAWSVTSVFQGVSRSRTARLQAYRPLAQAPIPFVNVTLRTTGNPEQFATPMRRALAELDSTLAFNLVRTAQSLVDQGLGNVSLLGTLLGAFAALGLALAAIGIYGVTWSLRRSADAGTGHPHGARRGIRDVLWLILSTGSAVIAVGASDRKRRGAGGIACAVVNHPNATNARSGRARYTDSVPRRSLRWSRVSCRRGAQRASILSSAAPRLTQ